MNGEEPGTGDLYLVRGDTLRIEFSYDIGTTKANAVPVDLDSYEMEFKLWDTDENLLLSATSVGTGGGIELNADDVIGRVRLTEIPSVTTGLPVSVPNGEARFAFTIIDSDGVVDTFWVGKLYIVERVTT